MGPLLQWSSSLFGNTFGISNQAPGDQMSQQQVNSSTFTFSRISSQNSLPLMSRLLISPVSNALNGSVVRCKEITTSTQATTSLFVIMDQELDLPEAYANISLVSQHYEDNGVTVILELILKSPPYSYRVNITPHLELIFNESRLSRVQLTALYNILYNFSVVAVHPCGQHNVTSFTELYYTSVDCGNPAALNIDSMLSVVGFRNPARLGSSASLSCSPGFVLVGPNRTTCMGNGEWEPDIGKAMCEEILACDPPSSPSNGYIIPYTSTVQGAMVTYVFQTSNKIGRHSVCADVNFTAVCNNDGQWELTSGDICFDSPASTFQGLSRDGMIAVACSVTAFSVGSLVFFIVGFLCGRHLYPKQKRLAEPTHAPPLANNVIPVYDDIILEQHQQEMELKTNVAYGPLATAIT